MKLSQKAWNNSYAIIQAIKHHPFNQKLMQGTLALDKFAYYLEQDTHYLQDFARCHAILAAKAPLKYVRQFLGFADYTFIAEQELVHHFFRETFHFQNTGKITPAMVGYTSYLLNSCSLEPVEVGIAAILPCFWIYQKVGLEIAQQANPDNPFFRWIETYSSEAFAVSVNQMIDIFDEVAAKTSEEIQQKMLQAFYKSTCWEWHFWNDAYYEKSFDSIKCFN